MHQSLSCNTWVVLEIAMSEFQCREGVRQLFELIVFLFSSQYLSRNRTSNRDPWFNGSFIDTSHGIVLPYGMVDHWWEIVATENYQEAVLAVRVEYWREGRVNWLSLHFGEGPLNKPDSCVRNTGNLIFFIVVGDRDNRRDVHRDKSLLRYDNGSRPSAFIRLIHVDH